MWKSYTFQKMHFPASILSNIQTTSAKVENNGDTSVNVNVIVVSRVFFSEHRHVFGVI